MLKNPNKLVPFLVLSLIILACDGVAATIIGMAFNLMLGFTDTFILLAALGISSVIPSAPGYVGLYQIVAIAVLVPLGFQKEEALVYILGFQGIGYIFIGIFLGVGFLKML